MKVSTIKEMARVASSHPRSEEFSHEDAQDMIKLLVFVWSIQGSLIGMRFDDYCLREDGQWVSIR